jgi:hypothetical protein
MELFGYKTQFWGWLKDRIFPPGAKHPRRCLYYGTEGWESDYEGMIKALRLDDELGVVGGHPKATHPDDSK